MTVKLVRCYFLAYLHLGDINFNKKKKTKKDVILFSITGVNFTFISYGQEWLLMFRFFKFDVVDVNLVWKHQQKTFLSNFSVQNASDSLFVGPC